MPAIPMISTACGALSGPAVVPGDGPLSLRALVLAALTVGESRISGVSDARDVQGLAKILRHFGAEVSDLGGGDWSVHGVGVGGFAEPDRAIDCVWSSDAKSLLLGAMVNCPITATFVGDHMSPARSLAGLLEPLSQFGARTVGRTGGRLPMTITGARNPIPVGHTLPVPSELIKSALLLAGLNAPGRTVVTEQIATPDDTERMLIRFGADVQIEQGKNGSIVTLTGHPELTPQTLTLPRDLSAAAFPVCAGLIVPGSDVVVPGVGLNPSRAGLVQSLREMGANLTSENEREVDGIPVADLRARYSPDMRGVDVPPDRAAGMIRDIPVLSVLAANANGVTMMRGVGELRDQQSDRLAAMVVGLRANGVDVEEGDDWLSVTGHGPGTVMGGAICACQADPITAMSFLLLGMAAQNPVSVDDSDCLATGFADFVPRMIDLGASLSQVGS